jgi:putative effector of murein hydrolase
MERGIIMLLHSVIIGLILYILMVFVFKQKEAVAENRSILISAVILIYMILFGHGVPDKLNSNL